MFSSEGQKDSSLNSMETGEFVFNYVGQELEAEMNASSVPAPAGVSEFDSGQSLAIDDFERLIRRLYAKQNMVAKPQAAQRQPGGPNTTVALKIMKIR